MVGVMFSFLIVVAFLAVVVALIWLLRSPLLWIGAALLVALLLEKLTGMDAGALISAFLVGGTVVAGLLGGAIILARVRRSKNTRPDPEWDALMAKYRREREGRAK